MTKQQNHTPVQVIASLLLLFVIFIPATSDNCFLSCSFPQRYSEKKEGPQNTFESFTALNYCDALRGCFVHLACVIAISTHRHTVGASVIAPGLMLIPLETCPTETFNKRHIRLTLRSQRDRWVTASGQFISCLKCTFCQDEWSRGDAVNKTRLFR